MLTEDQIMKLNTIIDDLGVLYTEVSEKKEESGRLVAKQIELGKRKLMDALRSGVVVSYWQRLEWDKAAVLAMNPQCVAVYRDNKWAIRDRSRFLTDWYKNIGTAWATARLVVNSIVGTPTNPVEK